MRETNEIIAKERGLNPGELPQTREGSAYNPEMEYVTPEGARFPAGDVESGTPGMMFEEGGEGNRQMPPGYSLRELVQDNEEWYKTGDNGDIIIDDKQLGRKMGKHAQDYGLDPHNENDRAKFRKIIDDIIQNYDEVRVGTWRDLGEYLEDGRRADGEVVFLIKGNDAVVLKDGNFVTILENGVTNARIKNAKIVHERE